MQFRGILWRVIHAGNAALRQSRIAKRQFLLAQQQNPTSFRQVQSAVQTGSPTSCNDHIISLFHTDPFLSMRKKKSSCMAVFSGSIKTLYLF